MHYSHGILATVATDLTKWLREPSLHKKVLTIGIGTTGALIVSKMEDRKESLFASAYVSCDEEDLAVAEDGKKLLVKLSGQTSVESIRGSGLAQMTEIRELVEDYPLVTVVASLGGGVGSALAPLIVDVAKAQGAATICVAIMPMDSEKHLHFHAGTSLRVLRKLADAVILVDSDALVLAAEDLPVMGAYTIISYSVALALSAILSRTSELGKGVELRKLMSVLREDGYAILTAAVSHVENGQEAVFRSINSLMHSVDPKNASSVIHILAGGDQLSVKEAVTATQYVSAHLREDAKVHTGFMVHDAGDQLSSVLLASGFTSTRYDEYDPISKVLGDRVIDDCLDSAVRFPTDGIAQLE
jgi:cell division protein FtsZ